MSAELHGPASWEGPAKRLGPVSRVAVLSDVHANIPALTAVLAERDVRAADLIVFNGDLTWGAYPDRTVQLVQALGIRAVCVRGNTERFVRHISTGKRVASSPREEWVPAHHDATSLAFVGSFPFSVVVGISGLGDVRFCHGSPRSDNELVTPGTSEERFAELAAGIEERVLVTGHAHLQFDRHVAGRRSVNPGSVGLPFHEAEPGTAYWALLGPDVELRRTRYDIAEEIAAIEAAAHPGRDDLVRTLTRPPKPTEIIGDAEGKVFSD